MFYLFDPPLAKTSNAGTHVQEIQFRLRRELQAIAEVKRYSTLIQETSPSTQARAQSETQSHEEANAEATRTWQALQAQETLKNGSLARTTRRL